MCVFLPVLWTTGCYVVWEDLLCVLCSLEHRGGWPLLPVVPLPGYCSDGTPACIGFPSNSYACIFCMLLVVVVCLPLFHIHVCFVGY